LRYQTKFLFFLIFILSGDKKKVVSFIKEIIEKDVKKIFKKFLLSIFIYLVVNFYYPLPRQEIVLSIIFLIVKSNKRSVVRSHFPLPF